jgi:hypothetical protein
MKTTWRSVVYLLLIAGSLSSVAVALGMIYRQGSSAVPLLTQIVQPGDLSSGHAFLSGACESCHTPLQGVGASTCISCHATEAAVSTRASTAFHADIKSCVGCHIEHQGEARPTRMDHQVLIDIGQAREAGPGIAFGLARVFSRSPEARETLDCSSCHSNRSPHQDLFGKNCAVCHVTESWRIAGFKHPSPASTDCAQCHQAPPSHYMGHFNMVSRRVAGKEHATVQQCHLCHQTDAWNNIRGVGWYKHH